MALFDIKAHENAETEWKAPTFKDCAEVDVEAIFFNENEHAEWHTVDKNKVLVILEEDDMRAHSAHWEAGAKQNFDNGLYNAHVILYIKAKDYGPKPKIGKLLVMDEGTDRQRTYSIKKCSEEGGVYRITMERVRQ